MKNLDEKNKDFALKKGYIVALLGKNDLNVNIHYVIIPSESRKKNKYTSLLFQAKRHGATPKQNAELIQNIFTGEGWSYTVRTNGNFEILLGQITVPEDYKKSQTLLVNIRPADQKPAATSTTLPATTEHILINNEVYEYLTRFHKRLGMLGVPNRDQEYREMNIFHFNYFDELEMQRVLLFFQKILKEKVSVRSGKKANIQFELSDVTINDLQSIDEESWERINIATLSTSERLNIIRWVLNKITRTKSFTKLGHREDSHTTLRVEIPQDVCSQVKELFRKIGFYYFEEAIQRLDKKTCSMFVALSPEFSNYLADTSITKNAIFAKCMNEFLITQEKPINTHPKNQIEMAKTTKKASAKKDLKKQENPCEVFLSRYRPIASKAGVKKGFNIDIENDKQVKILATDAGMIIMQKMATEPPFRKNTIDIRQYVCYEGNNIFTISKSWDHKLSSEVSANIAQDNNTSSSSLNMNQLEQAISMLQKAGIHFIEKTQLNEKKPKIKKLVIAAKFGVIEIDQEKIKSVEFENEKVTLVTLTPQEIIKKLLV